MSAIVLDGVATAAAIKSELRGRVSALKAEGIFPGLATILVGNDPGSRSYVAGKHRDCAEVGIASFRVELPETTSEKELCLAIDELNNNHEVTGMIVQLPLPSGLNENAMLERVSPLKDADGLHPMNLGKLVLGVSSDVTSPIPCTPAGVIVLLERFGVPLAGKRVVVIGRGLTVGRPISLLLTRKGVDATVILTHSRTEDVAAEVKQADIVIAACGVPGFVKPEWLKAGAAVLDVGITRIEGVGAEKTRLVGDVDPECSQVAGFLSPNPGGVGPMTRAMLLMNVVSMASSQRP